jgi:hypothetical protein
MVLVESANAVVLPAHRPPMTSRPSTAAPILAVLAIVLPLLLACLYVGGYFWLGQFCIVQNIRYIGDVEHLEPECPGRSFKSPWLVIVFKPMGHIESFVRGGDFEVISSGN